MSKTIENSKVLQASPVKRRSFLKAVGAGLVAFVPIATGLMNAKIVFANNDCEEVSCVTGPTFLSCASPNLYVCEDEYCYSVRAPSVLCSAVTHCSPIGCC